MRKLTTIKGFADMFVPESSLFTYMEDTARRVFGAYGYQELRIPVLEYTELFSRSIGAETDVVQKEMFTMQDRKGRSLTMRPEATAGIMRAYIGAGCHAREPVSKLFSFGPMFRYERPQKGRMRQFHQLDCECLGVHEPQLDAEVIFMLMGFLRELGLDGLELELNTLGCRECRPGYKDILADFLRGIDPAALCEDCKRRVEANPLRVLDCKVPSCKEQTETAPQMKDHVCGECREHFDTVCTLLREEDIPFIINPRLVRGLDYYMRTTFEAVSTTIGAQGSVAGGGRYDGLIQQLGGPDVPGIGFACGMERLALMLADSFAALQDERPDFFIAALEDACLNPALHLAQTLRKAGLAGTGSFTAKSVKSQMRQASRLQARYVLLLGGEELQNTTVVIKNMDSGEQETLALDAVPAWAENVLNEAD